MAATFVAKEVPTGVINGVNTVFTTAHTISQLDDIFIDGAIYTGSITVVGATITLGDAPNYTIYVDYYYGGVPVPPVPTGGYILLQDAKTGLLNRLKDISDVSDQVFCQWCDFVNKFLYRFLKSTDPERFIKETTLTIDPATSTATLPTDFRDIAEYGSGVFIITPTGTNAIQMARTMPNSINPGFYIKGSKLYITPNSTGIGSVLLRYLPSAPSTLYTIGQFFSMDGTSTSEPVISDEYLEGVVDMLVVYYFKWDEDPNMQAFNSQDFAQKLTEIAKTMRKEPESVFMPDLSTVWSSGVDYGVNFNNWLP